MRRLVINLDDDLDLWLSKKTNQNQIVRDALYLYKDDITTESIEGIRQTYTVIAKTLKEIDSKIDYIANQL